MPCQGGSIDGNQRRPDRNETPTGDQLSAVAHLIKHGLIPFVDMGVFGPNALRIVRRVRLTATRLNNEGELVKIEINGPASYGMWSAAWAVYQNTLLMLDAVDLGRLTAYKKRLDRYYDRHGQKAWALLYQTDFRTRLEHFPR